MLCEFLPFCNYSSKKFSAHVHTICSKHLFTPHNNCLYLIYYNLSYYVLIIVIVKWDCNRLLFPIAKCPRGETTSCFYFIIILHCRRGITAAANTRQRGSNYARIVYFLYTGNGRAEKARKKLRKNKKN